MRGLELNANMLEAKATFLRDATTAPVYRLWSVNDRHPAMIRVLSGGAFDRPRGLGGSSRGPRADPAAGAAGSLHRQGHARRRRGSSGGARGADALRGTARDHAATAAGAPTWHRASRRSA